MKGKRDTTEDKIRILREADRGEKSIQDICRQENVSEVTFHRWKKQFGHMEIHPTRPNCATAALRPGCRSIPTAKFRHSAEPDGATRTAVAPTDTLIDAVNAPA